MTHTQNNSGFTLVELAIVMTIIGLLIGGVLKGQELLENARVTSTISQVRGYEGAIATFRDTYGALPGDMVNAAGRIPGCGACTATPTAGVLGDGIIGNGDPSTVDNALTSETTRLWYQLKAANMISGVTDAAVSSGTVAWNETHPAAPIGGGFNAKTSLGAANANYAGGAPPASSVLATMQALPATFVSTTTGSNALSPLRAEQIDRKIDDGDADSGRVRGLGVAGSCVTNGYNTQIATRDCNISISLVN